MGVESEFNHRAFHDAVEQNDIAKLTRQIVGHQFLLIHLADESDQANNDEILGALTAEYQGMDYLVAFSNQEHASEFVERRTDLFDGESEVGGFWVDGQTMLDYLDDELGLLINPDSDQQRHLDNDWIGKILDELNLM
ncbi:SseB family protein [Neorhodopirellula pilleata]|uniref:SseB protein N-terminal domain-containing protein n=1 Tax=Neorhodopirellula pilleata TaxID=2714738 RepID=A0A5C6ACZ6_9BACT|nr:SseB family protein [Neorhodopirellula pilleata]TWT97489.1 hypothetical protein Pla100_26430 [Neorhodopirellula pilleata]